MENHPFDIHLIQSWLREAGQLALAKRTTLHTSIKSDRTLVTNIDQEIEALLLGHIFQHYPNHQALSEEGGRNIGEIEYLWIIDPIDGTRAYASGLPIWGISIGILKDTKPYAGIFFMPATEEMYWSIGGQGFYNDIPLDPLNELGIESPLAFIAVPSSTHLEYNISFPRLRSMGSTAAHLAYVASGIATAALTRCIKIWDVAGVLPILRAVGADLVYLSGKPFQAYEILGGQTSSEPLIAAPTKLIEHIREFIQVKSDFAEKILASD